MDEDLKMAHVRINDLEREINRADDRMVLLMDERNRLRKEYKIVLTAFVQLATEVEVIQRQSARAGEMLKSANVSSTASTATGGGGRHQLPTTIASTPPSQPSKPD
jgi:hypothetical protein